MVAEEYKDVEGGDVDMSNVDYETSKYLGGDVSRTHLVKGLDFVLADKIRAEQERLLEEKLEL